MRDNNDKGGYNEGKGEEKPKKENYIWNGIYMKGINIRNYNDGIENEKKRREECIWKGMIGKATET